MVKIGMMIGDRYEILEKIGTGGMSDVYKSKDHKLNRFVAVKVLKQEFSENENFVSKFRVEAQAAAGLMHSNIVNVYDVGEENGIYYIVMELVEGITLKKYIEKKARLSFKEAVSIAIQVSMGIEAAHNNHIIHRDIKPQNIIISKDGKVKVTDFGIAKAATSNTITSNVMGSVHYTSPEQARGGYSDEKSDVYSLGITLFEMLTGRVPFNGETTVAIAIKHIQEELPSPREFVPEIPASVEAIVLKCCQKSPDRRYQSMSELIHDLKQSLINPDENFVVANDVDVQAGTRMISDTEMEQIKKKSVERDNYEDQMRLNEARVRRNTDVIYEQDEEEEDGDLEEDDTRMEKVTTILAIVAGAIILIIILVLLGRIFGIFSFDGMGPGITTDPQSTSPTTILPENTPEIEPTEEPAEKVEMIDVSGWELEKAQAALAAMGLNVELTYVESDDYEAETVIGSDIVQGTMIDKGSTVNLTVSSGVSGIEVPDTKGRTYEEAYSILSNAGFLISRQEEASAEVEGGRVITQLPVAGEVLPPGSTVTVVVSLGVQENKILMPNLIGQDETTAIAMIKAADLVLVNVSHFYSDEIQEGLVCYQSYSAGTPLDSGTHVDIGISKGRETATYKCNAVIDAPTNSEAPDYLAGSEVRITLVTDDGKTLLDTNTSSFPHTANYFGITASAGTITIYYNVTSDAVTTVDPNTGETITTPGQTEQRSFTRRIEFTQE